MQLETLRRRIAGTTRADWRVVTLAPDARGHAHRARLRHDADIELRWGLREEETSWQAPWWARFADPHVRIEYLDVLLRGTAVDRVVLARVNGGSAVVPEPLPRDGAWYVLQWEVEAARLVNELEGVAGFHEAFRQTGIVAVVEL